VAVRPRRANPISTRPIYLARVPAKEAQRLGAVWSPGEIRLFLDVSVSIDAGGLVAKLSSETSRPLTIVGSITSALAGHPQTELRQTISSLGNRLAWARIRDESKREYRLLPLRGEVDAEEALYKARTQPEYGGVSHPAPAAGPMYDAAAVQAAFADVLNEGTDLVITARQLAAWDSRASRWTAVGAIRGSPAVISTAAASDEASLLAALRQALS
jgi:hypothetical protein